MTSDIIRGPEEKLDESKRSRVKAPVRRTRSHTDTGSGLSEDARGREPTNAPGSKVTITPAFLWVPRRCHHHDTLLPMSRLQLKETLTVSVEQRGSSQLKGERSILLYTAHLLDPWSHHRNRRPLPVLPTRRDASRVRRRYLSHPPFPARDLRSDDGSTPTQLLPAPCCVRSCRPKGYMPLLLPCPPSPCAHPQLGGSEWKK